MNKNIKLAVAGAVLALSATAANAGIVIPAGDWTLDVSGNVNTYTSWGSTSGNAPVITSLGNNTINASAPGTTGGSTFNHFGNGLLPNFLGFSGSTRQNDLDVAFTISIQPGSTATTALNGGTGGVGGMTSGNGGINNRQAFVTFGDKSWGSVKVGKDLGVFASDAILNDMTLLGVGMGAAGSAGNTSLGRIGAGYIYADWKPQISYTTPNFSGFQATVGISQAFSVASAYNAATTNATTGAVDNLVNSGHNSTPSYEGKASYAFNANDVAGKVWVSGIATRAGGLATSTVASTGAATTVTAIGNADPMAYAADVGANLNYMGFGLTGYGYYGSGIGSQGQMLDGYGYNSATGNKLANARDSYGGYVQATYVLPIKTKVGISWGESKLDLADNETALNAVAAGNNGQLFKSNEMWTVGLYHPLTKHLNLVAEYNNVRAQNQAGGEVVNNVGSLGAILFF